MREAIIIAGPNGAGKSTFANAFLPSTDPGLVFVNADEIGKGLADLPPAQRDLRAGRIVLSQIDALARAGAEFAFETTLATLSYAQRIPAWRAQGYHVSLVYLRLPDVDASIARVRRRVAAGGHDVPEQVIRRRFARSLDCLEQRYKPIVDEWYIYDSIDDQFHAAERWDDP